MKNLGKEKYIVIINNTYTYLRLSIYAKYCSVIFLRG